MVPVHSLTPRTLVATEHRYPAVSIDQTETLADRGSRTPRRFTADVVASALSDALSGIARRVGEGNRLGRIEALDASIGALARAGYTAAWPQLTLVAQPVHAPRIDVTPGEWRWDVVPPIGSWLDARV